MIRGGATIAALFVGLLATADLGAAPQFVERARLRRLIRDAAHAAPGVRLQALRDLKRMGPKARAASPTVAALLNDPKLEIRLAAAAVLEVAGVDSAEVLVALVRCIAGSCDSVGEACAFALYSAMATSSRTRDGVKFASTGEAIAAALAAASPDGQTCVLKSLSRLERLPSTMTPVLMKLAGDADKARREAAIECLSMVRPSSDTIARRLEAALGDVDQSVALWAAIGLARVRPQTPKLLTFLMKALRHSSPGIRGPATYGLAIMGPYAAAAVPLLRHVAAHDPEEYTRGGARSALIQITRRPRSTPGPGTTQKALP